MGDHPTARRRRLPPLAGSVAAGPAVLEDRPRRGPAIAVPPAVPGQPARARARPARRQPGPGAGGGPGAGPAAGRGDGRRLRVRPRPAPDPRAERSVPGGHRCRWRSAGSSPTRSTSSDPGLCRPGFGAGCVPDWRACGQAVRGRKVRGVGRLGRAEAVRGRKLRAAGCLGRAEAVRGRKTRAARCLGRQRFEGSGSRAAVAHEPATTVSTTTTQKAFSRPTRSPIRPIRGGPIRKAK